MHRGAQKVETHQGRERRRKVPVPPGKGAAPGGAGAWRTAGAESWGSQDPDGLGRVLRGVLLPHPGPAPPRGLA